MSRIAAIIVGGEFPRAVAMADAISSESEEDVPAVTTTDTADDEEEEEQAVETKPAAKLLLVERGRTMTESRRSQKERATAHAQETGRRYKKHYTSKGKDVRPTQSLCDNKKQRKNSKRNT